MRHGLIHFITVEIKICIFRLRKANDNNIRIAKTEAHTSTQKRFSMLCMQNTQTKICD